MSGNGWTVGDQSENTRQDRARTPLCGRYACPAGFSYALPAAERQRHAESLPDAFWTVPVGDRDDEHRGRGGPASSSGAWHVGRGRMGKATSVRSSHPEASGAIVGHGLTVEHLADFKPLDLRHRAPCGPRLAAGDRFAGAGTSPGRVRYKAACQRRQPAATSGLHLDGTVAGATTTMAGRSRDVPNLPPSGDKNDVVSLMAIASLPSLLLVWQARLRVTRGAAASPRPALVLRPGVGARGFDRFA